ncbi:hypothetical protein [Oceanobacillus rekensis]|uniref:hypothetical protein n=1 Tax=Oceanobacillus rekensis TaxID=937927 RepID=UPI001FECAAEF|nr:hypothetical protein [Oceanobacillus rekensis]
MHDVLTLIATVKEDMFTYRELPVYIVLATEGTERGQSIADIRPFVNIENETDKEIKTHRIAFELDYQQFYMGFMTNISGKRFY